MVMERSVKQVMNTATFDNKLRILIILSVNDSDPMNTYMR